ncbi:MAG: hypothetical protein U0796_08625 [Gemmatales bacterium]
MPLRRAGIGLGSLFTSRIDAEDNKFFELRVTSTNSGLITGNLTRYDAGIAKQLESFSGSFSYRNRKLIAILKHPIVDEAVITLIGKAHQSNPSKDHFLIKSDCSLTALFKLIDDRSGGNTGGTAGDPDAEGFNRNTGGNQNQPMAGMPLTTGPINARAIAPGSVIVKNGAAIVGYDVNGEIFDIADMGPIFSPKGIVFYGTPGAANSGWVVTINDPAFIATAIEAQTNV